MDDSEDLAELKVIVQEAFSAGGGVDPYPWQSQALLELLSMVEERDEWYPTSYLCVSPTGGGKSKVRDIAGHVLCGVTITITPLLSLGADQVSKILTLPKDKVNIAAYHVDELSNEEAKQLIEHILKMPRNTGWSVQLFCSPHIAREGSHWHNFVGLALNAGLLRLVCVDEVHLFLRHGKQFRKDIEDLKAPLFDKLKVESSPDPDRLLVPVLLLTATPSSRLKDDYADLTGLALNKSYWPSSREMARRQIRLTAIHSEQTVSNFKDRLERILGNDEQKAILYTNTKDRLQDLANKTRDYLDVNALPGDVVVVHGDLYKEQKFFNTRLFTSADSVDGEGPIDSTDEKLDPRILLATSGSANCGLDSKKVYLAVHDGFPPGLEDLLQEMGRPGRRKEASPDSDEFLICFSLSSYIRVLNRIYTGKGIVGSSNDEKAANMRLQETMLNEVVAALVLERGCLHAYLEKQSGSPETRDQNLEPCVNACSNCAGLQAGKILSKKGVKGVLSSILIRSHDTCLLDELPTKIRAQCGGAKGLFATSRTATEPKLADVKFMVLQLLAAEVIQPVVKRERDGSVSVFVTLCNKDGSDIPNIFTSHPWALLPNDDSD